jgi:hypothetical protein
MEKKSYFNLTCNDKKIFNRFRVVSFLTTTLIAIAWEQTSTRSQSTVLTGQSILFIFLMPYLSTFFTSWFFPHFLVSSFFDFFLSCRLLQYSRFYRSKTRNYERDGPMTIDGNQGGAPNYFPNSFSGPKDNKSFVESTFKVYLTMER